MLSLSHFTDEVAEVQGKGKQEALLSPNSLLRTPLSRALPTWAGNHVLLQILCCTMYHVPCGHQGAATQVDMGPDSNWQWKW